jgi:hypothetical protein
VAAIYLAVLAFFAVGFVLWVVMTPFMPAIEWIRTKMRGRGYIVVRIIGSLFAAWMGLSADNAGQAAVFIGMIAVFTAWFDYQIRKEAKARAEVEAAEARRKAEDEACDERERQRRAEDNLSWLANLPDDDPMKELHRLIEGRP